MALARGVWWREQITIFRLFRDKCLQLIQRVRILSNHLVDPDCINDRRLHWFFHVHFELSLQAIVVEVGQWTKSNAVGANSELRCLHVRLLLQHRLSGSVMVID